MHNSTEKQEIITCQGCESSCDVYVIIEGGEIVRVEGNNCPTGAIFAVSQCKGLLDKQEQRDAD